MFIGPTPPGKSKVAWWPRVGFHPLAIFPVTTGGSDFTNIDFRVEVGGKRLAMAAGVGIDDIDLLDLIQVFFAARAV